MSDFNKGDFTQQGVDGHVRATLRLNEKRYVELDLTTNENARGCTISGNVHDRLNNLDYPIGAAPSGNIEITENGENINVAPYATATVNVAGGGGVDLLHTTVNIVNNGDLAYIPDLLLLGYAVKLSELNDNYEDVLYCTRHDGPYGINLTDLSVSVPRNSTLTFNAYYLNNQPNEYMGGIMRDNTHTTATNMTYNDGGWGITDITRNSTLTYTVEK